MAEHGSRVLHCHLTTLTYINSESWYCDVEIKEYINTVLIDICLFCARIPVEMFRNKEELYCPHFDKDDHGRLVWISYSRPSTKPHLHYKISNVMSFVGKLTKEKCCVRMSEPTTGAGIQKYQNYVENTF